jgi:diaminohydroxyphosphoribosylaminopyrimidine deaminase / 5-amino-6-(5-phosphoribosylamino)uracil reductase
MLTDQRYLRLALRLARRGYGATSPNPMVGAVLVRGSMIIGRGWHHRAGQPHAEIEALHDARRRGHQCRGATLFVTLEPCSTHGRTPPCAEAIIAAGIRRVVVGATDPNPRHAGRGFALLRKAGIAVTCDVLAQECSRINEPFNHWIVHQTPFVTVKAAMTLDGKIATASGESKWITGPQARAAGMKLRREADAILVGVNTVLADNPSLTLRPTRLGISPRRRIVLDACARTPLRSKLASDQYAAATTVIISRAAPKSRVARLSRRVRVLTAPARDGQIDLRWLLRKLGAEQVTGLLVEGGGEVHASFLLQHLAHRIAFFYAPKILGGREARKAVAGTGARNLNEALALRDITWRRLGADWLLIGTLG